MIAPGRVAGGAVGAKLVLALQRVLLPGALMVAVNTGDDFERVGLAICPDVDTMLHTLADHADSELACD